MIKRLRVGVPHLPDHDCGVNAFYITHPGQNRNTIRINRYDGALSMLGNA